jgi:hypothetical protein
MFPIPAAAEPLVRSIRQSFTTPTFDRFITLMCGLIVTMGRRTVSRALLVMQPKLAGHWCNYHRLYSSARFSMWRLGAAMVREVVALLPDDAIIMLIADDTVDAKRGDHVWGKGTHHDARRSSRSKHHLEFGHQWLVMCVLVQLPGLSRPWALPILCGLCISPKVAAKIGRRPKTPADLTRQMLMRLMRWLPQRRFILLGDAKVITHRTARFAQRHPQRLTVISRLRGDANLYDWPRRKASGGYTKKGCKRPSPAERAALLPPRRHRIAWYGSSRRTVSHVSETALWYNKHSVSVAPIRWVCVLGDPRQRLDNAYFYSSDLQLSPQRIIELYAMRWNIEVTFEESRALLGLQTTRHWCRQSVLRVVPLLLGLFSAVTLMWNRLPRRRRRCLSATPCYAKQHLTFADALYAVRRELWQQTLLRHSNQPGCLSSLPPRLRDTLLWHLTAAA